MENIVVMKFGGKSLENFELFRAVAAYIHERLNHESGLRVVAVVSAMGKRTDEIMKNLASLDDNPPQRELAAALQVGEAESAPYLAVALAHLGVHARSYNALQLGIQTTGGHSEARITTVNKDKLLEALGKSAVAVVTGYQGVDEECADELTVLGRGGTDATAVALAKELRCHVEFYKAGVAGVHAFDPRISKRAKVLSHLTHDEAKMLTEYGYEFLMRRSLDIAQRFGVTLEFRQTPGLPNHDPWKRATIINAGLTDTIEKSEHELCALAVKENQAVIAIGNVPNTRGWSRRIYSRIDVPFIDSHQGGVGNAASVFIIADNAKADYITSKLSDLEGCLLETTRNLANITLVDRSANEQSHLFDRIASCLDSAGVNIEDQYSSGTFIHTLVGRFDKDQAVLAIAREFNLEDKEDVDAQN